MVRYQQLLDYLKATNMVASEQLECFVTDCHLQLSGKLTTAGGIIAAYKYYTAVYEVERFKGPADELLAHIACWIATHDQSDNESEQLDPPSFDIEPVNANTVDVMVEVNFCEQLHLVRDDNGPYQYGPHRYRLEQAPVDEAETVEVDGEACHE